MKKYTKIIFSLTLTFLILSFYILNFGYIAKADTGDIGVAYEGQVQNVGWQKTVHDGEDAGTSGLGLRLEALKINLTNSPVGAHIKYKAQVQNIGWQNIAEDGCAIGTYGQGLRVEAIEINLENVPGYSVEYRVHVQNIGWQNWVSNGAMSGTTGESLRIEAIEIKIVPNVSAASISLNKNSGSLAIGGTDFLIASLNPNSSTDPITWSSSNSNIAAVDSFGNVTGLSAGTVTISATTESGFSDSCSYIVTGSSISVTKLKLSKATDSINLGTADTLKATITPTNATDTNVNWMSSDTTVATVNKGVVTAVNVGTTTITAVSEDGSSKTDSCIVTIKPIAVTAVKVNKTTDTIALGGVDVLSAIVTPIYATDANVQWTSSNTNVVTVDNNGLITGVSTGAALVTAISEDSGATSSCTVTVSPNSVTDVTLNQYNATISVGNNVTLTPTITPDNATNQAVVWTTSDPTVATVSDGVVTGIKASTTPVTITVTTLDGGYTDVCDVTVTQ